MKWRTDKPTADLIVAYVKGYQLPMVLKRHNQHYVDDNWDSFEVMEIEKWADLEEDNYKTTYPNADFDKRVAEFKQQLINKNAITNYEDADPFVGIYWTQLLEIMHSFGQWGLDQFNYPKDETVTDYNELVDEIKNYFQGYWPGIETAEQCNTDMHFTPLAIMRLAKHFAKWGAEHTIKELEPKIKLVYGKVSMNPFDCSEAFEELLEHLKK